MDKTPFRVVTTSIRRGVYYVRRLPNEIFEPYHPRMVQIVVTRQCNLDCGYCNEYDQSSPPVPLEVMRERINKLAELGSLIVTLTGGEPLLHPDLVEIVAHVRNKKMLPGLITNGSKLTQSKILELNAAGLHELQISIDNVRPDTVSRKSLSLLITKLDLLRDHALFKVRVNSVLGSSIANPEDADEVTLAARARGFSSTVGIIHDGDGEHRSPLTPKQMLVYRGIVDKQGKISKWWNSHFGITLMQDNMAAGRANDWHCRAGATYLYVCENGLVHLCSQTRTTTGRPLMTYTKRDLRYWYHAKKGCAPYCTVGCVHRVSQYDLRRSSPQSDDPNPPPPVRDCGCHPGQLEQRLTIQRSAREARRNSQSS